MSGSLNSVQLIGNLGRDPEVRRLNSGDPVITFSIATSESWRDKATGERMERTEWHNIVCFNEGLCKIIEQYCKKGSKIYVEGKMQTRKWTDKDGADRYSTEVVLQKFGGSVILLGDSGRPAPSEDSYGKTATRQPARQHPPDDDRMAMGRPGAQRAADIIDDDIPF